jgi:hypothetical protein
MQMRLFDGPMARAARDTALAQVEDHASPAFLAAAEVALYVVAKRSPTLTTDDVWRELDGRNEPHEPRAMGPVMMRGKANGWIVPTPSVENSEMVDCHSRPKRVWQSLIWGS